MLKRVLSVVLTAVLVLTGIIGSVTFSNTTYSKAADKVQVKLEAENAVLAGFAKTVSRADASGGYKVGMIDNSDSTVTFTLEAEVAGTYRIDLASGSGTDMPNASHKYYVNGDTVNAKTIQYSSDGWDNWGIYHVEVALNAGTNTFTVTHSGLGSSYSELDYIVFYTSNPKVDSLKLDGTAMDAYDSYVSDYDVDVEYLDSLPVLSADYAAAVADNYDISITQATKEFPVAKMTLKSKTDTTFSLNYTVNFFDKNAFSNPIVNYGADPFVTYQDGYYYYCRVLQDKAMYVSRAPELNRIAQTEPVMVYQPSGTDPTGELWAPELHFIDGKWYIYYTAGAGDNHRMYVLESKTSDALGQFIFKGKVTPTTDRWGIDQTVLEYKDQLYAIWSGWEGTTNVEQRIYIAKMSNPWTISGERVELSRPEFSYELDGTPRINEGAQVATSPNGIVNVLFSASGSWTDNYCLGQLTLKADGDPMVATDWTKSTQAVFMKSAPSTYSTGHACFTTSPDGKESYIVYHANRGTGQSWNGRGVRTQRFTWNEDGTPNLGKSIAYNGKVNRPSGTPVIERTRYEAEDGSLKSAIKESTYNSSDGTKVTGLTTTGAGITFKVNVAKAGSYKLYVGAATRTDNVKMDVKVNDAASVQKNVYPFNASTANGLCPDNWMGYEVTADLLAGENTIFVGKVTSYTAPDVDYLDVELVKASFIPADKVSLQTIYDQNKGKVEAEYTAESFIAFKKALTDTAAILNNDQATQVEVDQAKASLNSAIQKLVVKPKVVAVSGITLKENDIFLAKNATYKLTATVAPETATNKALTWTSSNTAVVTVDANGTITAVGSGSAVITVKAADGSAISAACKISVPYSINYVLNKGTNSTSNPVTYFGTEVILKNPVKAGYTFLGWYTESTFITKITTLKTGDYTVYAKWKKISVAKPVIKTVKSSKVKQFTVSLKAKVSGAVGYEFTYALDNKFKKSVKKATIKATIKASSKTISKLKSKKTYYVKVRAYKLDSAGKKVFGKYSSVKKIKVK